MDALTDAEIAELRALLADPAVQWLQRPARPDAVRLFALRARDLLPLALDELERLRRRRGRGKR